VVSKAACWGFESLLACQVILKSAIGCEVPRIMKIFGKISNFITEVKVEMQKVSWSTKDELIGSTTVVIASTLLLAMFIGAVDILLSRVINLILR
jgi:preprotein translocase subunit SecE